MILIVAYGNDLRGDDGAGLLFAKILEHTWRGQGAILERLSVQQLLPELAVDVARSEVEAVVFVDTAINTVHPILTSITDSPQSALGHTCSPTVVMQYAEHLYGRRPAAWMLTLPGTQFAHGRTLSPHAQSGLADAQRQALNWLEIVKGKCGLCSSGFGDLSDCPSPAATAILKPCTNSQSPKTYWR